MQYGRFSASSDCHNVCTRTYSGCFLSVPLLREGDVGIEGEEQAAPRAGRVEGLLQQPPVPAGFPSDAIRTSSPAEAANGEWNSTA